MNLSSFSSVGQVVLIPVNLIKSEFFQFRKDYNYDDLKILADSIKINGLLQPILLNYIDDKFYIISGERRFRAFKLCGFKAIPSLIINVNKECSAFLSVIDNIHRVDLTCDEKNDALLAFKNDFLLTDYEIYKKLVGVNLKNSNKPKLKMVSDVRLFFNSFNSTVEKIKNTGLTVKTENYENDDYIEYSVKIFKKNSFCNII